MERHRKPFDMFELVSGVRPPCKQTPEARKRTQHKYYAKNKEKLNADKVEYLKKRYAEDQEFREKAIACQRERRRRKHVEKAALKQQEEGTGSTPGYNPEAGEK